MSSGFQKSQNDKESKNSANPFVTSNLPPKQNRQPRQPQQTTSNNIFSSNPFQNNLTSSVFSFSNLFGKPPGQKPITQTLSETQTSNTSNVIQNATDNSESTIRNIFSINIKNVDPKVSLFAKGGQQHQNVHIPVQKDQSIFKPKNIFAKNQEPRRSRSNKFIPQISDPSESNKNKAIYSNIFNQKHEWATQVPKINTSKYRDAILKAKLQKQKPNKFQSIFVTQKVQQKKQQKRENIFQNKENPVSRQTVNIFKQQINPNGPFKDFFKNQNGQLMQVSKNEQPKQTNKGCINFNINFEIPLNSPMQTIYMDELRQYMKMASSMSLFKPPMLSQRQSHGYSFNHQYDEKVQDGKIKVKQTLTIKQNYQQKGGKTKQQKKIVKEIQVVKPSSQESNIFETTQNPFNKPKVSDKKSFFDPDSYYLKWKERGFSQLEQRVNKKRQKKHNEKKEVSKKQSLQNLFDIFPIPKYQENLTHLQRQTQNQVEWKERRRQILRQQFIEQLADKIREKRQTKGSGFLKQKLSKVEQPKSMEKQFQQSPFNPFMRETSRIEKPLGKIESQKSFKSSEISFEDLIQRHKKETTKSQGSYNLEKKEQQKEDNSDTEIREIGESQHQTE